MAGVRSLIALVLLCLSPYAMAQEEEADTLALQAQQAREEGRMQDAIRLNEQEIALRRKKPKFKLYLANSIHTQAVNFSIMQEYSMAISLEEEALAIFRTTSDRNKNYVGVSLNNLAAYHFSRGLAGDYAKAEAYGEEALKYEKSGTEDYVNTVNQLVVYHAMAGHHDKADAQGKKLLKQGKKVFGLNTIKYAEILSNQSVKLAQIGSFNEAIAYAEESTSIYEELQDTMNADFATLLMNTANYYAGREDYASCVKRLERARTILHTVEGESGINYMSCTGELSSAYNHMGDLQKADDLANATQAQLNASDQETATLGKAQSLKKQAEVFANNGNYKVAVNMQQAALDIYDLYGDSLGMAEAYNTLSNYYFHNGDANKAQECCKTSIGLYSRNGGRHGDVALAYNSMSIYCYHNNNYAEALRYANDAVLMYESDNDTTSSYYAKALANSALYNYASGDVEEAILHSIHSYNIQKSVLGEGHPDNVNSLFNIAQYYYASGNKQQLYNYFHKALELQSHLVRSNFSHMTTGGREMYWKARKNVFSAAPTYAFLCDDQDSLLLDAYNAQLFTKGILLNSEIDFRTLLMQSGDTVLLKKYTELTDLNNRIASIYSTSVKESTTDQNMQVEDVESMQRRATRLERELMRESKEYGDYTANMTITATDIAKSLNEGDVAIELFEIEVSGGKAYYAMYMKKDWPTPRLVKLFSHLNLRSLEHNGKDFYGLIKDREGVDYIFTEGKVGQMVWNPLIQDWGKDVKNVYFSPSGLFYQWGIEYLLMGDGQRICDKYNLYRLSSTKQLAQRTKQQNINTATVFGGLDYDIEPALMAELHNGIGTYEPEQLELTAEEQDMADVRSIFDLDNTATDSLALRGSVKFLQGALDEASQIYEQLTRNNVSVELYTRETGIEENFKALSGKSRSVVHIATHGFSLDNDTESRKILDNILGESWNSSTNDANLNYSGLMFAGANNVLNHLPIPENIENGILTSREISMLDLRGIDMMVLSACQTGLGEIKEDGVFGLQRGFKKAGTNTLMMSLWSVSDRATQIMMTNFYSALVNGMSRHNAFRQAQESVRQAGFTSPFYWASFIMLDDI